MLTRRKVLWRGAAGLLGMALLEGCRKNSGNATATAMSNGYIDAHSHVWTADFERFPVGPWVDKTQMKPAVFSAEQLLEIARPLNVQRAVLIQHSPYFGYDSSYLYDCVRRYPGVFSVVGRMDERKPELAARFRAAVKQGLRGVRIAPKIHGDQTPNNEPFRWLETPGMQALWKIAADQNFAVCPIVSPEFLPTLAPMCKQFPQTLCVLDHFAHVDIDNAAQLQDLLALASHRNVYVKLSAFYKFGEKKPPYERVIPLIKQVADAFGPERLMWGSDCPYQLQNGNNYAAAIELVRDCLGFLGVGGREAILRGTAARVFFSS